MKKIIKLTESDLHRIIENSVKRIIKEAHGEPESYTGLIYNSILDDYKAQEMADEYGLSEDEAAAEWFKGVAEGGDFEEGQIPMHRQFVMEIPELDCEMYKDYGAGYYFIIKKDDVMSNEEIDTAIDTQANMDDYPV